jgi:DNA-nicking Smr family endonuclease
MPSRKPRGLSQGERALWQSVARTVTPGARFPNLQEPSGPAARPVVPAPTPETAPPAPAPTGGAARRDQPSPRADQPLIRVELAPDPLAASLARPQAIGGRRHLTRLARGKLQPEGRIDLHGMTQAAAHAALVRFVRDARERGLRHVLVITGKGRPDQSDAVVPARHGILRHSLPHWLAAPPLSSQVIEMRQAHPRHGGAGAVYLFLRRPG